MFKALKGMLYEDDGSAPAPSPNPAPQQSAQSAQSVPSNFTATPASATVSPEFVAAIRKVVLGRNTALTQLLTAADKLASIIPDANTRFKAAYATVSDGRNVKQIVDAVDVHLSDVEGEELRFKAAIDQKIASEVGSLEMQARQFEQQAKNCRAEIEAAQKRIAELTVAAGTADGALGQALQQVAEKKTEIEAAAGNFKLAASVVRAELNAHKTTILTALS